MGLSARGLVSLVKEIVRREVVRVLPALVEKTITESYLRKIIQEQARPRTSIRLTRGPVETATISRLPPLSELLGSHEDDEDRVPEPQEPVDSEGIYVDSTSRAARGDVSRASSAQNEAIRKLRAGTFGDVFSDVKTISESVAMSPLTDAPVAPVSGMDFDRMKEILDRTKGSELAVSPINQSKLREIEARRAALEVPVILDE